jgi:hypothetical protein
MAQVGPPKSKRKLELCFRVDSTQYAGSGFSSKVVFAADEEVGTALMMRRARHSPATAPQ